MSKKWRWNKNQFKDPLTSICQVSTVSWILDSVISNHQVNSFCCCKSLSSLDNIGNFVAIAKNSNARNRMYFQLEANLAAKNFCKKYVDCEIGYTVRKSKWQPLLKLLHNLESMLSFLHIFQNMSKYFIPFQLNKKGFLSKENACCFFYSYINPYLQVSQMFYQIPSRIKCKNCLWVSNLSFELKTKFRN